MAWSDRYVGIPFLDRGRSLKGVDCYGLVYVALLGEHGLEIPALLDEYEFASPRQQIAGVIRDHGAKWPWRDVTMEEPQAFDLLIFRARGADAHCGIVVQPPVMLHIFAGPAGSHIADFTKEPWPKKLSTIYRHIGLT